VIRIAISPAAFDAIAATPPLGTVAFEKFSNFEAKADAKGDVLIWLEPHVVNKLRYLRGPGESYRDVILRVAAGERRS
jgi:hypothetical protein